MEQENQLTETEVRVKEVYETLKELSKDEAPCVAKNAQRALAVVWQIMNDLGLEYEQLYDYGG
ncbi:MAG TPA: hypothetical protein EYP49_10005 [Anaerolineae bacterium]|nr:hypothetical protein [Anaerolineae bacterium]